MKYVVILFIVLFSFSGFSQKKEKHGPYMEHYENGNLKTEGQHRKGIRVGTWKTYSEKGKLKGIYGYNDKGNRTGFEEYYYDNGNLRTKISPLDQGGFITKFYNKKKDALYYEYTYYLTDKHKKVKNGFYKQYYKNRTLRNVTDFKDGERHGAWKRYYPGGELEWEVAYQDGKKVGLYKYYYPNGTLKLEGLNIDNMKSGLEKRYLENGNLFWTGSYFQNELNGAWTQYDSNGNQIKVIEYDNGVADLESEVVNLKPTLVPDEILFDKMYSYESCKNEQDYKLQRSCVVDEILKFLNSNFNNSLNSKLNAAQPISVRCKVDEMGKLIKINVKTEHSEIKEETILVLNKLPEMKPAILSGEPVTLFLNFRMFLTQKGDFKIPTSSENEDGVAFSVVEEVPIYPGCKKLNSNDERRACMSKKISEFVSRKFDTSIASKLGLVGRQRINVVFKIDQRGEVTGVRARSSHSGLEEEAKRVIRLLPKMIPGIQEGAAVVVPYSLPIIFMVQKAQKKDALYKQTGN